MLRAGAVWSEKLNSVSAPAALLFHHMLTVADDFGLIELSPSFVKMRCFPGRQYNLEEIAGFCTELLRAGLLREYAAGGKRYAAILQWDQTRWAKQPAYPMPPWGLAHITGGYVAPRARGEGAAPMPPRTNGSHGPAWWRSDEGIRAKFTALGLKPVTGESLQQAKERCFEEMARRKAAS